MTPRYKLDTHYGEGKIIHADTGKAVMTLHLDLCNGYQQWREMLELALNILNGDIVSEKHGKTIIFNPSFDAKQEELAPILQEINDALDAYSIVEKQWSSIKHPSAKAWSGRILNRIDDNIRHLDYLVSVIETKYRTPTFSPWA